MVILYKLVEPISQSLRGSVYVLRATNWTFDYLLNVNARMGYFFLQFFQWTIV